MLPDPFPALAVR